MIAYFCPSPKGKMLPKEPSYYTKRKGKKGREKEAQGGRRSGEGKGRERKKGGNERKGNKRERGMLVKESPEYIRMKGRRKEKKII